MLSSPGVRSTSHARPSSVCWPLAYRADGQMNCQVVPSLGAVCTGPTNTPSTYSAARLTPTSSVIAASTVTVPATSAASGGAVMTTVGGVGVAAASSVTQTLSATSLLPASTRATCNS